MNSQLREAFRNREVDVDSARRLLKEASSLHVDVDKTSVEFSVRKRIEEVAAEFASHSADFGTLEIPVGTGRLVAVPRGIGRRRKIRYMPHSVSRTRNGGWKPKKAILARRSWLRMLTAVSEKLGMKLS